MEYIIFFVSFQGEIFMLSLILSYSLPNEERRSAMKRMFPMILLFALLLCVPVRADELTLDAPSALLMEKQTGTVLFAKDEHTPREPASVTKVMTLLLTMEAIDSGALSYDDTVTGSAHAASMGGSQIWLKEGEQMSVDEMLKCIAVNSANDCAVAMAEHISGSEEAFTKRMNDRAKELGTENTQFLNCTGLTDDPGHYTTARDIACMSRALLAHPRIREYTTIWMDTVRDGRFGLANTNKLIHAYPGATGLKTGYTQQAMHCLSASAERDGVEYIAVVLHAESSKARFADAAIAMDETLEMAAVDISGRGQAYCELPVPTERVGSFDTELAVEFFYAFARDAKLTLHVRELAGGNSHHIIEAAFKAVGRTMRHACELDPRVQGIPSTKGSL